jgi:DNA-binding transcriptional ArsR family regulator
MSMPRKKTAATRSGHPDVPRRPPEIDASLDRFLCAVCDRSRRYILELLAEPNESDPSAPTEYRSGEIAERLGLSTATTSEHLRQLADLYLVTTRKQGAAVYYRLSNHMLIQAFLDLLRVLDHHYRKQSS